MGPDEQISREEFDLVMDVVFGMLLLQQNTVRALTGVLLESGVLTPAQAQEAVRQAQASPPARLLEKHRHALDEFLTMRGIARSYLDRLGENQTD
jgi:hypothetical protein